MAIKEADNMTIECMDTEHRTSNASSIIMIRNAPEPELGTIIGSVGGFMSVIGCYIGLAELDVAMYYFHKGKPAKMSLDSLLHPIDERLTNRFHMVVFCLFAMKNGMHINQRTGNASSHLYFGM